MVASVIKATGEMAKEAWCSPAPGLTDRIDIGNMVIGFEASGLPLIFGGDLTSEIKSVVDAVASGKHAAIAIDILFKEGKQAIYQSLKKCAIAALDIKGDTETTVVAWAGDGGTFDIVHQALSGAAERNEDIIYVCYDNEAYMNTGIQRSSSTPYGA